MITGVPAGYTVIVTQILSETSFLVEEVDLDKTRYLEPENLSAIVKSRTLKQQTKM